MDNDLYGAAINGDAGAMSKLEMQADETGEIYGVHLCTILHIESWKGNTDRVRFILRNFANKFFLVKLDTKTQTALHYAACYGMPHVVEVLIDEAREALQANDDTHNPVGSFQAFIRQANRDLDTALSHAVMNGKEPIVRMLVEADPTDKHIQNREGKTPLYIAVEKRDNNIVKLICTTCTAPSLEGPDGDTALHAAIRNGACSTEAITMIINAAKGAGSTEDTQSVSFEALFNRSDASGYSVLELAADGNYVDVVELILKEDPAYQHGHGIKKKKLLRLICQADRKEYKDIVKLLSKTYEAGFKSGIDPDHRGVVDLLLAIQRRDKDSVLNLLDGSFVAGHLVTNADDLGWTALHYATYYQFDSIIDHIMEMQKLSKYQFEYEDMVSTPLLIAAEKGYTSTIKCLMKSWPSSSSAYTASDRNGQNILHLAALQNKKEMIQYILNKCPEIYKDEIVNKQDNNGNTVLHLLISRGCFIPEIMKYKGLDLMLKNKERLTPEDMLYSDDQIIGDQVQYKIELDKFETKHKLDRSVSVVLPLQGNRTKPTDLSGRF